MNKIEYCRLAHPFEPCGRVPGLGILHQRGRGETAPSGVEGAAAAAHAVSLFSSKWQSGSRLQSNMSAYKYSWYSHVFSEPARPIRTVAVPETLSEISDRIQKRSTGVDEHCICFSHPPTAIFFSFALVRCEN